MLAGYWSGVPAVAAGRLALPRALRERFLRYPPLPLDPGRAKSAPWIPALRRVSAWLLPRAAAAWADFWACRLFDRWAAARLGDAPADAVIACEISALAIFRAAKRRGMTTILDAPSLHHRTQDRLHGTTDSARLHRRITAVKDREIELADHVLTVSDLARDTYVAAGAPAAKVHAVTLGADLELFRPRAATEAQDSAGCVFLFAGAAIRRKGFDLLVQAFAAVAAEEPGVELRIVGPRGDEFGRLEDLTPDVRARVTWLGSRTQEELALELRRADCLVLPSRNDSYGMVVPEALASGTPVLLSAMVGAGSLVAAGRNGWVVPVEDAGALAERMLWCARHRAELAALRAACRRSAAAATWEAHHARVVALLGGLLPPAAPPAPSD